MTEMQASNAQHEWPLPTPSVGQIVHYVSYGTPGGEYPSVCRAAVITAVGDTGDLQLDLAVLNPEGMFFNHAVDHDDDHAGGTWHWPERV